MSKETVNLLSPEKPVDRYLFIPDNTRYSIKKYLWQITK